MDILTAYGNSIFRTVFGTVLTVVACMALAYPLAKRHLPGRNILTIYLLITMFFSGGLIPTYLLVRSLGLIDNRLAYLLPSMVTGFNVIIMRNFLMTLDKAYEESAFIDGASYFRIFWSIVVPLSKPVIATVALWTAVWHWNSWFDGLIYMRSESKIVLQMVLRKLIVDAEARFMNSIAQFALEEDIDLPTTAIKAAVTIVTIGPIVLVYPFLQKHFIHGIFMGSLKG
jgi:putative aldouronate transport system permease protein